MKKLNYLFLFLLIAACSTEEDPGTPSQPPAEKLNPVAVADEIAAIENQPTTFDRAELLDNDDLKDNAILTAIDAETSEGGTITDNRDNTYKYQPPADLTGEDSFSYTICVPGDSDRCSSADVKIILGDAGSPVAVGDSYTTQEDKTYTISNHLSNDEVVDNAKVIEVVSATGNATVTLEADGSIVYTPNISFSGQDSFTYTLCDDDETPNCSTATVTMQVEDTGSPKAEDDLVVIEFGTTTEVIAKHLDNDDLNDDAVVKELGDPASNATISLNSDGTINYQPQSGFIGEDTFTYTICDDDPEATCSTATITVSIVEEVEFNFPDNLAAYYAEVTFAQDPELLYQELSSFTTTQHTNRLEYYQRHDYLYDADEDLDNPDNVILMYSGESRPEDEFQVGDLNEGETFNTEHIYPQSKLSSEEAKNDMHHMRVSDVDINLERLNYPFTDGSGDYKLVDGNSWFPGDDWRGDVARMVMYVNLRYGEDFDTVGTLQLFLEWNVEDPVSAFEIQRNNVIEAAQGNRNPFIDNPFLATLIWGGADAENTWE